MRILLVLEYYYPNIGGLEKLFKSLVDELAHQGHEITIVTNKIRDDQPKLEQLERVQIHRYHFYNRYLFTLLAFFPALRLARHADIIHTTSYNAGVPAFFAGWFTGTKVCITFHEVWLKLWYKLPFFGRLSKWLHHTFEWFLLRLPFDRFIAVSQSTKESLLAAGIPDKKVSLIYNGIDYELLNQKIQSCDKPKPMDSYTFLYFGRLGISKGLDVLIHALHLLQKGKSNLKLVLVIPQKPTSLFDQIQSMVENLDVGDSIQYLHELDEKSLLEQILQADAIVIPSYNEGFCFTAVESVALDKPIISSGRGALKEVVGGKFLTYSDQEPAALAMCMQRAMAGDWEQTEKKRFPLSDTVAGYIACYQKLLKD